jgi:hypothetical protein
MNSRNCYWSCCSTRRRNLKKTRRMKMKTTRVMTVASACSALLAC